MTFGRDPNDLTNARGRLPNDRPHVFRMMGSVDVPTHGIRARRQFPALQRQALGGDGAGRRCRQESASSACCSSRAARTGCRRSRCSTCACRGRSSSAAARVDVLLDVLNALNDTAEEGIVTDILTTETLAANPDFGKPNAFVDPRRAMLGVRLNLGR